MRSVTMTIIEGIGDEIIIFLAIAFIAAVIIGIFIFPSQYTIENVAQVSNQDESFLLPSSSSAEQNNTLVNSSSVETTEVRNESANDCNNEYLNQTCASPRIDHSNQTADSVQDLKSSDHSHTQSEANSINNPEFLRNHRLKFFGEQLASSSNERGNSALTDSDKGVADLASQHIESASSSNHTADHINSASPEGSIRIRLKYLNDTERLVYSKLDDKIGDFKRTNFSEDITNNKIIRLIYNGQLLRGEDRTLESFGITNNSVVHVQISQNQQPRGASITDDSDLDLSHLMWPLFGIILGVLWMLHFQYREYFNITSTVALVGITGLFLIAVWSQSNFLRGPRLRTTDNQHSRN